MSETTSPEILAKLVGRREDQPPKAGKRMLITLGEPNPLSHVLSGIVDDRSYCEQDFRLGASSRIWKDYLQNKTSVKGVLLDDNSLIWFPNSDQLSSDDVNKIAVGMRPDSQVHATFRFNPGSSIGKYYSEAVIKSRAKAFDSCLDPLVKYFINSLGENWETQSITVFKGEQRTPSFNGSAGTYLSQ
jgi:hypothetical protein